MSDAERARRIEVEVELKSTTKLVGEAEAQRPPELLTALGTALDAHASRRSA